MDDYIGKYVKQFESGAKGSLALGSCGNDWGLSCGSYQLTLRWGNCINFLKKYFPSESANLYFNNKGDLSIPYWPGEAYCSSPQDVRAVWLNCYQKVGPDKFFEYEHECIANSYYIPIKTKIFNILDLDKLNDRAFKECFWSWAVHKGSIGAYNYFTDMLREQSIDSLDYIDREELFDLIYDKRYSINSVNRYKKGYEYSEREILRPFLTSGTISGNPAPNNKGNENIIYKVQCGAFSVKENAVNLQNRIKKSGFDAIIVQNGYYKVQCGAFSVKENAKSLQSKLKDSGFDTLIVSIKK